MLSLSRKRVKKRQKSDESTHDQCGKFDSNTENMSIKSEIIEDGEECKPSGTDYEFVSVEHVKTETPDFDEFPLEGMEKVGTASCSDKLEFVSPPLGLVKTEMGDDNDDNFINQSKKIKVVNDDLKEEIFREPDGVELSDSNLGNLPKSSGFPCYYCFAVEPSLETLSDHIYRDHHIKQMYQCRTCSKVLFTEHSHKSHVSRHRLMQCAHCPYQGTSRTMNNHRRRKHSIQEPIGSSFSYKCIDCGMSFRRYYEELEHEKVVHKKVFPLYPNLREHKNFNLNYKKLP